MSSERMKCVTSNHRSRGLGHMAWGVLEFSATHPLSGAAASEQIAPPHGWTALPRDRGQTQPSRGPSVMRENQSPLCGDLLRGQTGNPGAGPLLCPRHSPARDTLVIALGATFHPGRTPAEPLPYGEAGGWAAARTGRDAGVRGRPGTSGQGASVWKFHRMKPGWRAPALSPPLRPLRSDPPGNGQGECRRPGGAGWAGERGEQPAGAETPPLL